MVSMEQFNGLVQRRVELIKNILANKGQEYAADNDRLHNFKRAAAMLHCSREQALVGMWAKHVVSILDIIDDMKRGKYPTFSMVDEKIGDAINYLILLEASIKDTISVDLIRQQTVHDIKQPLKKRLIKR
jgi:hypothetical protein